MAYSLIWLPKVLVDAGLKVAEVPGWERRGRGDVKDIRGVLCHHTAGPKQGNMPSLHTLKVGRRTLSGPLAHLGLGRDGTYYVIAAGKANHAGKGSWRDLATGNDHLVGLEVENTGAADDPYPDVQLDAYHRGVAAILTYLELDESCCLGHREWAGKRKIDPLLDMAELRSKVKGCFGAAARPLIPRSENGRDTVRRGDRGPFVRELQAKLGLQGSGEFDAKLEALVRAYQRQLRLVPDGIVGPKTWAALNAGASRAAE